LVPQDRPRSFGDPYCSLHAGARNWPGAIFALRISHTLVEEALMLETIAVVLVLLWLLGFVTSYTMGGLIHVLLVIAVVVILLRLIQGRRVI
jgi:hypothetical protein